MERSTAQNARNCLAAPARARGKKGEMRRESECCKRRQPLSCGYCFHNVPTSPRVCRSVWRACSSCSFSQAPQPRPLPCLTRGFVRADEVVSGSTAVERPQRGTHQVREKNRCDRLRRDRYQSWQQERLRGATPHKKFEELVESEPPQTVGLESPEQSSGQPFSASVTRRGRCSAERVAVAQALRLLVWTNTSCEHAKSSRQATRSTPLSPRASEDEEEQVV